MFITILIWSSKWLFSETKILIRNFWLTWLCLCKHILQVNYHPTTNKWRYNIKYICCLLDDQLSSCSLRSLFMISPLVLKCAFWLLALSSPSFHLYPFTMRPHFSRFFSSFFCNYCRLTFFPITFRGTLFTWTARWELPASFLSRFKTEYTDMHFCHCCSGFYFCHLCMFSLMFYFRITL